MRLVDWNCKRCGEPMPDKSMWPQDEYIYCPKCGAKHMIEEELNPYTTYQEKSPRPQWVESGTAGPMKSYDIQTVIY